MYKHLEEKCPETLLRCKTCFQQQKRKDYEESNTKHTADFCRKNLLSGLAAQRDHLTTRKQQIRQLKQKLHPLQPCRTMGLMQSLQQRLRDDGDDALGMALRSLEDSSEDDLFG